MLIQHSSQENRLISTVDELFTGLKGTVLVISSDPQCKEDNIRFATVPLMCLSSTKICVCKLIGTRLCSAATSGVLSSAYTHSGICSWIHNRFRLVFTHISVLSVHGGSLCIRRNYAFSLFKGDIHDFQHQKLVVK